MAGVVDKHFDDFDAFRFEELSLERSVGFGNENFSAFTDNAMPRNASSRRGRCQGPARGPRPAAQMQNPGERPVGSNPATGNLLHEFVDRIPAHNRERW